MTGENDTTEKPALVELAEVVAAFEDAEAAEILAELKGARAGAVDRLAGGWLEAYLPRAALDIERRYVARRVVTGVKALVDAALAPGSRVKLDLLRGLTRAIDQLEALDPTMPPTVGDHVRAAIEAWVITRLDGPAREFAGLDTAGQEAWLDRYFPESRAAEEVEVEVEVDP